MPLFCTCSRLAGMNALIANMCDTRASPTDVVQRFIVTSQKYRSSHRDAEQSFSAARTECSGIFCSERYWMHAKTRSELWPVGSFRRELKSTSPPHDPVRLEGQGLDNKGSPGVLYRRGEETEKGRQHYNQEFSTFSSELICQSFADSAYPYRRARKGRYPVCGFPNNTVRLPARSEIEGKVIC